jgi:hypothetical protein
MPERQSPPTVRHNNSTTRNKKIKVFGSDIWVLKKTFAKRVGFTVADEKGKERDNYKMSRRREKRRKQK